MKKLALLWITLAVCIYTLHTTNVVNAQFPPSEISSNSTNGGDQVTVSANLNVQVNNQTLDNKDRMLRSAITGFLTSGPNVLRVSHDEQSAIKTKIINGISNTTQSVEGTEATNAIIAVELTKALKSLISQTNEPNQTAILTVSTTSSCKPGGPSMFCDNTVNMK